MECDLSWILKEQMFGSKLTYFSFALRSVTFWSEQMSVFILPPTVFIFSSWKISICLSVNTSCQTASTKNVRKTVPPMQFDWQVVCEKCSAETSQLRAAETQNKKYNLKVHSWPWKQQFDKQFTYLVFLKLSATFYGLSQHMELFSCHGDGLVVITWPKYGSSVTWQQVASIPVGPPYAWTSMNI